MKLWPLDVGVTKKEDLAFIERDDLQNQLSPIQCCKVIQAFKQRGEKKLIKLCEMLHFTTA